MTLARILTWSDAVAVRAACADLTERFICEAAERLRGLLSRDVAADLAALPGSARRRVLTAPVTSACAFGPSAATPGVADELIACSVRVERRLLGESVAFDSDAWSALRDAYCPPGSAAGLPIRAERLPGGAVVDFDSPDLVVGAPVAVPNRGPVGGREPFTAAERDVVRHKLRAAMLGIAAGNAATCELVTRSLASIVPRKRTERDPDAVGFGAEVTRLLVGRCVLRNAHRVEVGAAEVADAVVRAAIRSWLFRRELVERPAAEFRRAAATLLVQSPWTGATVSLASLVYMALESYGVYQFFAAERARAQFPGASVERCVARSRSGFAGGALMQQLDPHRAFVADQLLDQVAHIQAEMRAS